MKEMGVYGMSIRVGLSLPEGLNTNNSISGLILSNNLLYNLCSFTQELVHLEKNSLSKMAYMEQKIKFSSI